jgi:hypothetical protein
LTGAKPFCKSGADNTVYLSWFGQLSNVSVIDEEHNMKSRELWDPRAKRLKKFWNSYPSWVGFLLLFIGIVSFSGLLYFGKRFQDDARLLAPMGRRPHQELGFSRTVSESQAVINGWIAHVVEKEHKSDADARTKVIETYREMLRVDTSYIPIVYAICLASLTLFTYWWARHDANVMLVALPFLIMVVDWSENTIHYFVVGALATDGGREPVGLLGIFIFFSFIITLLKWLLAIISVLGILTGIVSALAAHKQQIVVVVVIFTLLLIGFSILSFPQALCPFTEAECPTLENPFPSSSDVPKPPGHRQLQRASTSATADAIVNQWVSYVEENSYLRGTKAFEFVSEHYRVLLVNTDFLFPIVYTALIMSLLFMVYGWWGKKPSGFVIALPIAAALADYVENVIHVNIVTLKNITFSDGTIRLSNNLITVGYIASTIKIGLILAAFVVFIRVLYLCSRERIGKLFPRRPSRIVPVAFFILLILLLFMFLLPQTTSKFKGAGDPGHIHLEFSCTLKNSTNIIERWVFHVEGKEGPIDQVQALEKVHAYYSKHLITSDLLLPIFFACFLISLIRLPFGDRLPQQSYYLPFVMVWFDLMENMFHIDMVQGAAIVGEINNISTAVIETSYVFTWLKWITWISFLVLSILYAIRARLKNSSTEESL